MDGQKGNDGLHENYPATVRLLPDEVWVRDVSYAMPSWIGFKDSRASRGQFISLKATTTRKGSKLQPLSKSSFEVEAVVSAR